MTKCIQSLSVVPFTLQVSVNTIFFTPPLYVKYNRFWPYEYNKGATTSDKNRVNYNISISENEELPNKLHYSFLLINNFKN